MKQKCQHLNRDPKYPKCLHCLDCGYDECVDKSTEEPHETHPSWCCLCEYDLVVIKDLIVQEINIARSEGEKTSRLTSFYNKITGLKYKLK